MTRTGKIARLPQHVREPLNRRLRDGEPGGPLLEWLNGLPEAQAILKAQFDGQPINKQNLSEWRLGGFRDWERHQEALDRVRHLAEQGEGLADEADGWEVGDRLATALAGELALTAGALLAEATSPTQRWERLRELLSQLAELRRSDHKAARLRMDRDKHIREEEAQVQKTHEAAMQRIKDKACAPLWAMLTLGPLARAFGGGEVGHQTAAYILEVQRDLEPGTLSGNPPPKPGGSDQVKPGQTEMETG